ncbi:MAG: hypothetical protein A2836_02765 [Candidatus Taylorbacteria bacterium RIFCSPHIGHO2_01_FULL_45_63]|uniref:Coenzyme F420:L-glutamate ligase-like domain-containing protein n=1 Tax=Candidatus Taylorbacteria bacterium RIFCSPHIGHO2_02_FULL_45_35 TaxID=1802311 RepID=A0A1G2MPN5_9BACT|nr:MAG: hypothetical protein A2836_02765 [Candidatus Taylorbacteria bacterium RIFCSPHIGHO2_01_FULL_45_63]OHA25704.1 MAG: hypothetical protein A3D56_00840 [Candidatus Taylorbacteria bacterium RIFCSPHIGHO2_02_FULL_45_35]OHA33980.1 MAG: hypothetical protein A3A22_04195 [Candidatus Taylorbacteria bacterium RIFCSPLOWO2_01_FULL_45_34b]QBM02326.1 coenzyme F420:L-glutamate ligase [uncultured archaeon]
MHITPVKTRLFLEGKDLIAFIKEHIPKIAEKSLLIVTSKIVALAEKRTAVVANQKEKERLIRSESQFALQTKYVWLTIRDNLVMASAGIDESNGNGKLILLPKNSFKTAIFIRKKIKKIYGLKKFGVIITDSRLLPLRNGTVGVATGYAGFRGLKSYKGKSDLFGRKFLYQRVDVADSLATAAVFCMGEGNESIPLAMITSAPVAWRERIKETELEIDPREDVYQPLFAKIRRLGPKRFKKV